MPSDGEMHSMNKWQYGPLECGCSYYNVEVMGCDHDCGWGDAPYPPPEEIDTWRWALADWHTSGREIHRTGCMADGTPAF